MSDEVMEQEILTDQEIDRDDIYSVYLVSAENVIGVIEYEDHSTVFIKYPTKIHFGETGLFIRPFSPIMIDDFISIPKEKIITMYGVNDQFKNLYLSAIKVGSEDSHDNNLSRKLH